MEPQRQYHENEVRIHETLLLKIANSSALDDSAAIGSIIETLEDLERRPYFPKLINAIDPRTNPELCHALDLRAVLRLMKGITNYLIDRTADQIDA